MKRIDWFKNMSTRSLAAEFYYFDFFEFKQKDFEKTIQKIMRWLNEEVEEV